MNKRHYEHTLPNIRGSLSNTYRDTAIQVFKCFISWYQTVFSYKLFASTSKKSVNSHYSNVEALVRLREETGKPTLYRSIA